jgi:hypothetical protein
LTQQQAVLDRPAAAVSERSIGQFPVLWLTILTPAVLLLHGYHPFADDAGIYTAGISKLADPSLYQPDGAFVLANTHLSVFAHLLSGVLRITGIPFQYLLLITHLGSIFAFLAACWCVATRVFSSPPARWSAVVMAALCFTLPVAGTALVVMDPYVTSRSFSTPLGLFALAAAIDHRWVRTGLLLLLAMLMHPLMGTYAAAFVLIFALVDLDHPRKACAVAFFGVAASGIVFLATRHIEVSAAYSQAVHHHIRSFLFPSEWAWYEDIGLAAPLAIFGFAAYRMRSSTLLGRLCIAALLMGSSCILAAFLFIPVAGPYLLTRLQPLRSFHMLYTLGVILLGGFAGNQLLRPASGMRSSGYRRQAAAALLAVVIAAAMFMAQRATYPLSAHLELPGIRPRNPWQQAFQWIALNTPPNAVFGANPDLVYLDGEDSQGFRASTRRSILPDDKDEGVVVVVSPILAGQWAVERNAQAGLDHLTDRDRLARLLPFGATWMLLARDAETSMPCPYRNSVVQVCRLER